MEFWLRYDLRSPSFAPSVSTLAKTAIEQAAWADTRGFSAVLLSEHHGQEDGYNPSPLILGGAIASRTEHLRVAPMLLLPFYDPVRLAEDLCMLDQLSEGRVEITTGLGYVPSEFEMYGVPFKERGARADVSLQVLRDAFDGRPFDFEGRTGTVHPGPYRAGGPAIFVGGGVKASARRAARFGDGFYPLAGTPDDVIAEYERACRELEHPVGPIVTAPPTIHIHVSNDPERDWERLAPYILHEINSYARITKSMGELTFYREVTSVESLRSKGLYMILTPQECVAYLRLHLDKHHVMFASLVGGLDPEISWESLELLASEVIPVLQAEMDEEAA